jgi:hypothetical protein
MFNKLNPDEIKDWTCVYETGTEYDAEMVKNYFADQGVTSEILSKRDSSYNLNIGQMSMVYVYVPQDQEEAAQKALNDWKDGVLDIDDEPNDGE